MSSDPALTRRELLELGAAGGLALGLWPVRAPAALPQAADGRRPPRNVVLMVSDGLSVGALWLAELFARRVRDHGTHWCQLLQDTHVALGYFDTQSLDAPVTDSAAAVTAWATGVRVRNGALNLLPDGTELVPIGRLVRESGQRLGLVTTTALTQPTPAGFVAVQADRDAEEAIAPQYLDRVDVLLGGGRRRFAATGRTDARDLIAEFTARGYTHWTDRAALRAGARPPKVLGLFADGHLPYTLDQRQEKELLTEVPTLAEMTQAALEILADAPRGFLLQVEGGRVDHAAHANDAAALLWDQLAFDDAVGVAWEFTRRRRDTLLIVTSDHGTGNPTLNGMGSDYQDTERCFRRLTRATASFDRLTRSWGPTGTGANPPKRDELRVAFQQAFGIELTAGEVNILADALADQPTSARSHHRAALMAVLGQLLGSHTGVGWTGNAHTAELVPISALGPGAAGFAGLLKNTDAYDRLTALLGITHRNPRLSPEQAAPYPTRIAQAHAPHWL